MPTYSAAQSGAFIDEFTLPPTGAGSLAGLRFAVKDLIDVAGHRTSCGNPDWLATHPPARVSAVCVDQLLAAGASCAGKTICDEVAFSLLGENYFYGTPLNPMAPDRVPGGSSSGSASAVACGLVDFALGTDTGGSVRVPASYCGLWGMRPSHGFISLAGVMPFSPSFDTVGVLAGTADILERSMNVLLGCTSGVADESPRTIYLITEALALADADVQDTLMGPIAELRSCFRETVRDIALSELLTDASAADLAKWLDTFRQLRSAEVDSCLGSWVASVQPKFGPAAAAGFEIIRQQDRTRVGQAIEVREQLSRELQRALGPRDLLCLPTAPTIPPIKGTASHDRQGDFYSRTLSLTSIAGVARLPQISLPMANVAGVPVGLSLIGAYGQDAWLLQTARAFAAGHEKKGDITDCF